MRTLYRTAIVLATVGAMAAGCGNGNDNSSSGTPAAGASSGSAVTGTITVLAASSLTETFNTIGKNFEAANPGSKVTFSYAGSAQLAQQITAGAPADVFAAASPATMKTVTDKGDATGTPVNFVKNQLVIAVKKGNPKGLTSLAAIAKPGVKVALCAEQVPCGAAAKKALAAANIKLTPVTLEQDVKSALSKVTLGEVDAALVYRTDAKASASSVDGVEFPESADAINEYPIAALKDAPNPAGAAAFVAYVQSDPAQQVLTAAGFQKP
jgi:molybdate transport system substrate-binding protein